MKDLKDFLDKDKEPLTDEQVIKKLEDKEVQLTNVIKNLKQKVRHFEQNHKGLTDTATRLREMNKSLDQANKKLEKIVRGRTAAANSLILENDFLKTRIREVFGFNGYREIMAHSDCPNGLKVKKSEG